MSLAAEVPPLDPGLALALFAGQHRPDAAIKHRLDALVTWAEGRTQTIGLDDCVGFACGVAFAITNRDVLGNAWRGAWSNEAEAQRHYPLGQPLGLGLLVSRRMQQLGWLRCRPPEAPPGSFGLALVATRQGRVLLPCVATGAGWWLGRIERGVTHLQDRHVRHGWQSPGQENG